MDNLTHTLIGIGIANAFFKKRIGPAAVTILALSSNLPDIDAIVHLSGDPSAILYRRTFGHSIFTIPIWSLALAAILKRFYPHLRMGSLFGLTLLGASIHIFFDLVNSFGVVLLWPFSNWRPELAVIFIIDLFLTGILAFPLLLYLVPSMRRQMELLSRISIVFSFAYVIFCGTNRVMAQKTLTSEINHQKMIPEFTYIFPEPLGPHRWRGVIRTGDAYRIFLIYSMSGIIELKDEVQTMEDNSYVSKVKTTPIGQRILSFFKAPIWTIEEGNPANVRLYDLRFKPIVINRGTPFVFQFHVFKDGRVASP